jgi:hypothetical protein
MYSSPFVSQFRERAYQKSPSPNLKHHLYSRNIEHVKIKTEKKLGRLGLVYIEFQKIKHMFKLPVCVEYKVVARYADKRAEDISYLVWLSRDNPEPTAWLSPVFVQRRYIGKLWVECG